MQTETIFVFKPNNRGIYCACMVCVFFFRSLLFPFARLWLDIFTLTMCRIFAYRSNWNFAFVPWLTDCCCFCCCGSFFFSPSFFEYERERSKITYDFINYLPMILYKTDGFRVYDSDMPQTLWFLVWVKLRNGWSTRREKWTKWKTIDRFEMTKMLNYYQRWWTPRWFHVPMMAEQWNIIHARGKVFVRRYRWFAHLFVHYVLHTHTQHLRWTRRDDNDATSCSYQESFKHLKYLRLHVGRRWSATSPGWGDGAGRAKKKNGLHNSQRSSGQCLFTWFGNAVAQHQRDHLHCIPFA